MTNILKNLLNTINGKFQTVQHSKHYATLLDSANNGWQLNIPFSEKVSFVDSLVKRKIDKSNSQILHKIYKIIIKKIKKDIETLLGPTISRLSTSINPEVADVLVEKLEYEGLRLAVSMKSVFETYFDDLAALHSETPISFDEYSRSIGFHHEDYLNIFHESAELLKNLELARCGSDQVQEIQKILQYEFDILGKNHGFNYTPNDASELYQSLLIKAESSILKTSIALQSDQKHSKRHSI
jgi:hypothetical protein